MINLYDPTEYLATLLFYENKNPKEKQEHCQIMFDPNQGAKTKGAKGTSFV